MDKRTLLFMICVSAAFFGVHAWFDNGHDRNAYTQKAQEQQALLQQQKAADSALRTAKEEDLPLVPFYLDAEGKKTLTLALSCKGHFLTLAGKETLPQTLYISKGTTFEQVNLATPGIKSGELAIYSRKGSSPLILPDIPLQSPADLQLVAFNDLRIVLGEQRGETFSLPYNYLGDQAIALLKEGNSYVPVGIYDPSA